MKEEAHEEQGNGQAALRPHSHTVALYISKALRPFEKGIYCAWRLAREMPKLLFWTNSKPRKLYLQEKIYQCKYCYQGIELLSDNQWELQAFKN